MISPALSAPRSRRVRSWGSGLRLHRPPAACVTFATAVLPWRCRPPVQPQRQLGEHPGQAACSDLRMGHQTRAHSPGWVGGGGGSSLWGLGRGLRAPDERQEARPRGQGRGS